jgi:GT2 family glycosyltransferase
MTSIQRNISIATRNAEQTKWDDFYASLPLVDEPPAIKVFGEEFSSAIAALLPPGSKTIEAGCGAGWQSMALARTGKFQVSLLDFSQEALVYARKLFEREQVAATFLEGDVFTPGAPDYDLVFNAGVLEHYTFDEQVAFLQGMASRSRKYVLALVPNRLCYWYWLWRTHEVSAGKWPYGKEVPLVDMTSAFKAANIQMLGQAFMASQWTENFINELPGLSDRLRHEIIEIHRSGLDIPAPQKSYLVAFLGSVVAQSQIVPSLWSPPPFKEELWQAEMNAMLADALALRIGAENRLVQLQAQLDDQAAAFAAERDQLRVQATEQQQALLQQTENQLRQIEQQLTHQQRLLQQAQNQLDQTEQQLTQQQALLQQTERQLRQAETREKHLITEIEKVEQAKAARERELLAERDDLTAQLNLFYSTKAWRWTYAYWQLRRGGLRGWLRAGTRLLWRIVASPFRLLYFILHSLYHLLIPKKFRVAFWEFRWRLTHKTPAVTSTMLHPPSSGQPSQKTKVNKHIFIFGMVPYYDIGGGQRSAQLAKIFNRMGYLVHYIYAYDSTDTGKRDEYLPVAKHLSVKSLTPKKLIASLQGDPIFIFESPHQDFVPFLELAPQIQARTIYEHIDNWDTSLGSFFYSAEILKAFLLKSDLIVATAQPLKAKLEKIMQQDAALAASSKAVLYMPNAVDTDLFDPVLPQQLPPDLITGAPTLLYYGSLWGEWFDWALLKYVAEQCPACSINLIGDAAPIKDRLNTMPTNIHFLGPKLQRELPAYLHFSDIALLPFKNDEIGKYVSPLKIFEYIGMDKPVLATCLPDILGYPNVYASDDPEAWVACVKGEHTIATGQGPTFARQNDWYARCNSLLDHLEPEQTLPERGNISIIILNRNNGNIIPRCIESLLTFRARYQYEIIVVDNQSTDSSYELLQERYGSDIILLKNDRNGCSSGRNLGIQHAKGSFIVFLDSDQWAVSKRWLDTALEILRKNRNIGAVAWGGGWFYRDRVGDMITAYLPHGGIEADSLFRTDIGYLGTCGMLVRRETLDATSYFDENYDPTCYEDTDLSLQIRDLGYELAYSPYINIMHLPHQTTQAGSMAHLELMKRNRAYFLAKWQTRNPHLLERYYVQA